MAKISGIYRFVRAEGIPGFLRQNRVSTDALNALNRWKAKGNERSYVVTEGEDDAQGLVAQLTWDDNETDAASVQLDSLCEEHGVARTTIA